MENKHVAGPDDESYEEDIRRDDHQKQSMSEGDTMSSDRRWANGGRANEAVSSEARSHGIAPESAADVQLAAWLTDAPSEIEREAAVDILAGSILGDAERVIAACHTVASAPGGAFGLRKVSAPERDVLDRITYALQRKGIVSGRR